MHILSFPIALACYAALTTATSYQFATEYAGSNFFDDWIFYNHFDNLTNGDVVYVSQQEGLSQQLAFVNGAGNAIIKVDNSTQVAFPNKRNSVRISTKDRYGVGSLWVADMTHVPFGCSVWPAWWSQAPDWPTGGEIDTFEGVNQDLNNIMSLHTDTGCTHSSSANQTSTIVNQTVCDANQNSNSGCGITDPNPSSYGAAFAAAGGGIFVTEMAESGISIWFFNRSSIPSVLQGNASSFDSSILGTPVSNWPSSGCNVDQFFEAQNLIFTITLCGDLAGAPTIFSETCPGDCYASWVLGSPSNYDDAYFEVKSVRVFNNGTDTTVVGTSGSLSPYITSSTVIYQTLAAFIIFQLAHIFLI